MMYEAYDDEFITLQSFLEIPSMLDNFYIETANVIAQHAILSLKCDGCNCYNNPAMVSKLTNVHGIFSTREIGKDVEKEKEKKDHLNVTQCAPIVMKPQTVSLNTAKEVNWILEVMKYAINMPVFSNIEVVKHTVHIYCNWLTKSMFIEDLSAGVYSDTSRFIPNCIKNSFNEYVPIFVASLCSFFKNFINSYASLSVFGTTNTIGGGEIKVDNTHLIKEVSNLIDLILHTVEQIAIQSTFVTNEIWDSLMFFCLNVGNLMLSSPSEPNQITYNLSHRISCMVFTIWLQACGKCFPRPSLWKTLNKLSQMWRHQEAFINQWNKITAAFTYKLLMIMYSDNFPKLPQVDMVTNDMIPDDLNPQYIKDCWYRFLHLIGNPVDLCIPQLIFNSEVLDSKSKRNSSIAAFNHAINNMPNNFHRAMHGLSDIVDAFLGLAQPTSGFVISPAPQYAINQNQPAAVNKSSVSLAEQASPPETRKNPIPHPIFNIRRPKPGSINTRTPTMTFEPGSNVSGEGSLSVEALPEPHVHRPEANSMLKLFGNWLFEAAIVGVKQNPDNAVISVRASKAIEPSKFNSGRAEACASLCRIFTHCHRHNLSLDYLTKFYIILHYSLDIEKNTASSLVLSSVIFNTIDILKIGLVGVNILVPRIYRGIEFIFKNEFERPHLISKVQLKRAGIHHLLSMINLPTHFIGVDIKPLVSTGNIDKKDTFTEIQKSISQFLCENINCENDQVNLNLLIACLTALLENLLKEEQLDSTSVRNLDNQNSEKIASGSDIFNHSLGLLTINIIYRWHNELNSLQFALETLSDMSKMKFRGYDTKICKRAIRFLCEFIEKQMGRDNKEHSRQLHNVIISAYYCLSIWLVHHPYILDDKECLSSVLEISELGISGAKSKETKNGVEVVQIKNVKKVTPSSKRVQVAAEYMLQCIMSEVGAFPGPIGAETTSSLAKEEMLLRDVSTTSGDENQCCFRYFGLDNDIILALLERPIDKDANPSDPLPTLSVIIRTTFGRYVWEMRLRQLPTNNQSNTPLNSPQMDMIYNYEAATNMLGKLFSSRPFNTGIFKQFNDIPPSDDGEMDVEPCNFPEVVSKMESFQVEFSIPRLESLMDVSEKKRIESAIMDNLGIINAVRKKNIEMKQSRSKTNEFQCKKPMPVTEFQTARLLLYHLGYLSVNSFCYDGLPDISTIKDDQETRNKNNRHSDVGEYGSVIMTGKNNNNVLANTSSPSLIYQLDSSTSNFFAALDALDRTPSRSTDTCLIYYVKSGQSDNSEIIGNYIEWPNFSTDFLATLLSLGWQIDVNCHPGWTGCTETSFHVGLDSNNVTGGLIHQNSVRHRQTNQTKFTSTTNASSTNIPKEFQKLVQGPVPDGTICMIYWADSQKEVAFLMSSLDSLANTAFKSDLTVSSSETAVTPTGTSSSFKDVINTQQKVSQDKSKEYGMAVSLVWIEEWDDLENINISTLVGGGKLTIIVCPTPGGLFRIKIHRPSGKHYGAGPLFSGMILDIKNLGTLIRQTVINVNRRIRQDHENFFASHFQRSQKLQQIISEHRLQHSTNQLPDFFTNLLYSPINRTEPRF